MVKQIEVRRSAGGWEICRRDDNGFFPLDFDRSRAAAIRKGEDYASEAKQCPLLVEQGYAFAVERRRREQVSQ